MLNKYNNFLIYFAIQRVFKIFVLQQPRPDRTDADRRLDVNRNPVAVVGDPQRELVAVLERLAGRSGHLAAELQRPEFPGTADILVLASEQLVTDHADRILQHKVHRPGSAGLLQLAQIRPAQIEKKRQRIVTAVDELQLFVVAVLVLMVPEGIVHHVLIPIVNKTAGIAVLAFAYLGLQLQRTQRYGIQNTDILIVQIEKPTVKRIGLAERIDLKSLLPLVILRRRGDNHFGHVGHHERHFVTHRIFQPFAVAERPAVEHILRPKLNGHRYGRHKQIKKSSHNIFPTVQFSVTGSAITRLRVLRPKNNG